MFVEERLQPLKFSPQAHQGLVDNLQAICIPFPVGLNLRCNFCSCQSLFLSHRPFCKNTSCSEGFLTFINSAIERDYAGGVEGFYWGFGGRAGDKKKGIKSALNMHFFQHKVELEALVR